MKKIIYIISALALMAGFTACTEKEGDDINLDEIVLDGFYVYGEATGAGTSVLSKNAMSAGSNEVEKKVRTGMFEKYIWLEANKDFSLIENSAGNKTFYGAELVEVNYGYDENDPNCKNFADNPNMKIQQGLLIVGKEAPAMQVKETGLYHIVLDNNANGDLPDGAQIIIQKADWGVRGGMNGWGFTAGAVTKNEDGTITYTWENQEMSANGEFKFASCHGWKINLDVDGKVKAEVSLGLDDEGKLNNNANNNINVGEKAGLYKITLTYDCKAGAIADSFSYKVELTQESSLPTACYLIGDAINGWNLPGHEVPMVEAHSEAGCFWAIRYISDPTKGFKFSEVSTGWGKDFTGRGTDTGYTVSGGNCFVSEAGLYMIEVDYKNAVVTVSKAAVYGMGDAFGSWDEGKYPFTAADGKFTITTANANNLRMYAGSTFAAAVGNWWHREFNIYDGKIVYRGGAGDQAAVPVTAGQTVTLDFNAGTGSIK